MFKKISNWFSKLLKKSTKYDILLSSNLNLNLLYYKKFKTKYKSLDEINSILLEIENIDFYNDTIDLPVIGNRDYNYYYGFEFLNADEEYVKNLIIKYLVCKDKLELIKLSNEAKASVNRRKIEPHIINMETIIDIFYLSLTK